VKAWNIKKTGKAWNQNITHITKRGIGTTPIDGSYVKVNQNQETGTINYSNLKDGEKYKLDIWQFKDENNEKLKENVEIIIFNKNN